MIVIETISKTKQQLFLEIEALRTRLDATERRLQEANEILQAQIAERKKTEEALKISETRYRRLFETAQDGILILDADTGQISTSLQNIPQYVEVPPNIEAKPIVSYFSTILSY